MINIGVTLCRSDSVIAHLTTPHHETVDLVAEK